MDVINLQIQSINTTSVSLTVVLIISIMFIYYRYKHGYWSRRGIRGPKPYLIVGNLFEELVKNRPLLWRNWIKQYGQVMGTYSGVKPILLVADAELIKNILVKDAHVFPNRMHFDYLDKNTYNMLFFMRDARWKSLRSLLAFTMTSGKIKRLFPLMMESGDELMGAVGKQAKKSHGNNLLDTKTVYGCYTMDVIARSSFAARFDSKNSDQKHRTELVTFLMNNLSEFSFPRIAIAIMIPKMILEAIGFSINGGHVDRRLTTVVQSIIDSRRKLGPKSRRDDMLQLLLDLDASKGIGEHMLETTTGDESESHHVASADKEEIKEVLEHGKKSSAVVAANHGPKSDDHEAKMKLTDNEIIGNCQLFIIAGYDTTSSLLSFFTHTLAHHPEAQQKLYEEIKTAFPSGVFNYETVTRLSYLDACISEVLRLFPPLGHIDREANDDYRIDSLNLRIPKDGAIVIPIYAIHRDEKYYEQPDSFIPERFLPENRHKLTPYTYLPFGAGIRHCLGMRFALAEAKLALARLIFSYKFTPAPGHDFPPKLELSTALLKSNGLKVNVHPRTCT